MISDLDRYLAEKEQTMLIDHQINEIRVRQLRSAGCKRCARTSSRWLKTEFRRAGER